MLTERSVVAGIGSREAGWLAARLGNMGSALAGAPAATDLDVAVWNRSSGRCDALVARGAAIAGSVGDAVLRSEVVVWVRGHDAVNNLLRQHDIAPLLEDKIVVQLGNGIPTEVSDAARWFSEQGAAYLDGSIMNYPDAVGSAGCQVLVSSDPVALERCRPVFDAIGGDIRFVGTDPAASAVINSSSLAFVYLTAHAFVSAAAMCDAAGAPLDLLADVVGKLTSQFPPMLREYAETMRTGNHDSTTLRLATGAENLRAVAVDGDRGVNLAAIFETLRMGSR